MPVVLRYHGFVVSIFAPPREHSPPHVHVRAGHGHRKIDLYPIVIARSNMSRSHTRAAERIVSANADMLRTEWRRIHD